MVQMSRSRAVDRIMQDVGVNVLVPFNGSLTGAAKTASENASLGHEGGESGPDYLGALWHCMIAGIIVNALYCHISPGLMVRLQSNPWTTQLQWLFGVKAQNFQTLNFILYHQSFLGKLSHIPTIILDFMAWSFFIYHTFGPVACFLMLFLVVVQAFSSRFFPLVLFTLLSCLGVMTASAYASSFPADTTSILFRCAQVMIICNGFVRVVGHVFEEKQPPMPATSREAKWFRFKSSDTISFSKRLIILPQAILAETSAGMPLRLFVPLLNAFTGQLFKDTDEMRPEGLQTFRELQRVSKDILTKGWKIAAPAEAAMIRLATKLETIPRRSPDILLSNFWFFFFTLESVLLSAASLLWFLAPSTFISSLGWVQGAIDGSDSQLPLSVGRPATAASFSLSIAASIMACGFVWVLTRMLFARNIDIRAFCYVLEGLTLCLILQIGLVLDLQLNSISGVYGKEHNAWNSSGALGVYASSSLLLIVCAAHCFFLIAEVPRMRSHTSKFGESSCSGWSSEAPDSFNPATRKKSRSSSNSATPTQLSDDSQKTLEATRASAPEGSEPDDVFFSSHPTVTPMRPDGLDEKQPGLRQRVQAFDGGITESDDTSGCELLVSHRPQQAVRRTFTRFRPRMCSWPLGDGASIPESIPSVS